MHGGWSATTGKPTGECRSAIGPEGNGRSQLVTLNVQVPVLRPVTKPGVLTCREFMATGHKLARTAKRPARQCLCRSPIKHVEAAELTHR